MLIQSCFDQTPNKWHISLRRSKSKQLSCTYSGTFSWRLPRLRWRRMRPRISGGGVLGLGRGAGTSTSALPPSRRKCFELEGPRVAHRICSQGRGAGAFCDPGAGVHGGVRVRVGCVEVYSGTLVAIAETEPDPKTPLLMSRRRKSQVRHSPTGEWVQSGFQLRTGEG